MGGPPLISKVWRFSFGSLNDGDFKKNQRETGIIVQWDEEPKVYSFFLDTKDQGQ
jgi:hypothetical protein